MSIRPWARGQYRITPEMLGTIKRVYDLQLWVHKEKTQDSEGRRTGWAKKCFRSYVDFLPHCKVKHPPQRGGFFIGSVRRFFLAALSSDATPSRLYPRHRGRELGLPWVTSRRFSHLQAPSKLGPERNRWSLCTIQLLKLGWAKLARYVFRVCASKYETNVHLRIIVFLFNQERSFTSFANLKYICLHQICSTLKSLINLILLQILKFCCLNPFCAEFTFKGAKVKNIDQLPENYIQYISRKFSQSRLYTMTCWNCSCTETDIIVVAVETIDRFLLIGKYGKIWISEWQPFNYTIRPDLIVFRE